jgi:hypothetical protein
MTNRDATYIKSDTDLTARIAESIDSLDDLDEILDFNFDLDDISDDFDDALDTDPDARYFATAAYLAEYTDSHFNEIAEQFNK